MPTENDYKSHCTTHNSLQDIIMNTANNMGWVKKIGSTIVGLLAAILTITLPSVIVFFVYIAKVDTRLTVLEKTVEQHIAMINTKKDK